MVPQHTYVDLICDLSNVPTLLTQRGKKEIHLCPDKSSSFQPISRIKSSYILQHGSTQETLIKKMLMVPAGYTATGSTLSWSGKRMKCRVTTYWLQTFYVGRWKSFQSNYSKLHTGKQSKWLIFLTVFLV